MTRWKSRSSTRSLISGLACSVVSNVALGDALPVGVLEHAARDAAAGLHPAADRHAVAGGLDPPKRELQKLATTFIAGERLQLAAGDRLLACHLDLSLSG